MLTLGPVEAFRRYGARQVNAHWAVTAVAEDGSLVVSCWSHLSSRPFKYVMRYEDRLSRFVHNVAGSNTTNTSSSLRDTRPAHGPLSLGFEWTPIRVGP